MANTERMPLIAREPNPNLYPNLSAIVAGCVSGPRSEWPAVRAEMRQFCEAICREIEQANAALSNERKWIPVSEAMPEDGATVLGFWPTYDNRPDPQCFAVTTWLKGRWHNHDDLNSEYGDAAFWMPLPSAPEAK